MAEVLRHLILLAPSIGVMPSFLGIGYPAFIEFELQPPQSISLITWSFFSPFFFSFHSLSQEVEQYFGLQIIGGNSTFPCTQIILMGNKGRMNITRKWAKEADVKGDHGQLTAPVLQLTS